MLVSLFERDKKEINRRDREIPRERANICDSILEIILFVLLLPLNYENPITVLITANYNHGLAGISNVGDLEMHKYLSSAI